VSLPLYCVIFENDPVARAPEVAKMFFQQESPHVLATMIREIEFELQRPTQQVREIVNNIASEEQCREFLTAFLNCLREALAKQASTR
jgi:hypothetical protein